MKKYIYKYIIFLPIILMVTCWACKNDEINLTGKNINVEKPKVTINFIGHWLNEGKREDLVRNIAREYEFKNQHVAVNLKFPEEIYYDFLDRTSNEKFNAKIVLEKNPQWDIIKVNGEYNEIKTILNDPDWPRKYLVDFSQIEEFREGTRPELLTDEAKKDWNGIIPGPYFEGQYWAMFCNNKVAEKVGVTVKQYGMTVDDFIGYLRAVDNYNKTHPSEKIYAIYESFVWETSFAFALQMYASLLSGPEEFHSATVTERRLNAWEKTLEAIEIMAQYKPLNPNWRTTEWSPTQGALLNEECLFYINGSWMFNIWMGIDEQKTYNCMPAEFPSFGKFAVYPGANTVTWAVLKNAPNKDEAIKFLLAMNKPAIADTWIRYTKCPTGIKGSLSDVSFGGDQFENFSSHVQKEYKGKQYKYAERGSYVLDNRFPQASTLHYMDVIEGRMTAKEAMKLIRNSVGR